MAADVIKFLTDASKQVGFLSEKLERLRSKGGQLKLAKEFRKIAEAMNEMGKGLSSADMERQMSIITNSFKKSSNIIEKTALDTAKKRLQATKEANAKIESADSVSFTRRIHRLSSFTNQAIGFFKMQMLWYPTKALSFKLLAVPGDVIRSTAEYGDALLQVSSVARLLPGQLKDLDDEVQRTAANTKFSITELGEATKQLAQAGFQKDEIKAAIQPIALLATATASSVKSSTDLIATIVRAYGKSASDVANITDTLAAAVTKSRLTIEKLNDAFNYVASASAQAGVSFEDTTALLAVLANSGMKMSSAATGLRMSFLKLLAPTEKATNELKKFGLSPKDVDLTKKGIYEVLKTIESLPIDSVIKIFSARSASAILAINNVGVKGVELMRKAMEAHGLAATMAKEQLLGLKQSWKNLLDVITSTEYKFGNVFGDELALNIRTVKSYMISLGEAISDNTNGLYKLLNVAKVLAGVLASLSIAKALSGGLFATEAVSGLSKVLGKTLGIKKAFLILKAAIKGTSLAVVSESAAMVAAGETAEASIASSAVSVTSLINPWTAGIAAIVLGLGALASHYFNLRKNTEKLIANTAKYNVEIEKIKGNLYEIQAKGLNLKILKKEDADLFEKYVRVLKTDLLEQLNNAAEAAKDANVEIKSAEYDKLTERIKHFTGEGSDDFNKLSEAAQNLIASLSNISPIDQFIKKISEIPVKLGILQDAYDMSLNAGITDDTMHIGQDQTESVNKFKEAIQSFREE